MTDEIKVPGQEELEKELSEYLSKKYGYRIKVVSPMMLSQAKEPPEPDKKQGGADRIKFDMKPEELEEYLGRYVVKQDEAKAVLATKICTHYNRIRYQHRRARGKDTSVGRIKNNILLMGPTGVGKTYLVKLIAQKLGVPFVKGDATKFSETGYVGGDVEDLVRELLVQADDDVELAQYGIIYVDEIDKIASSNHFTGPDVSRMGVQRALLKPMEETEVDLKVAHDPISQLQAIEQFRKTGKREKRTVNTRNILFIMSGAFNGLAPLVKKRLQKQGMGFGAQVQSKGEDHGLVKHTRAEDLIDYGFESEFIGRLPVMAVLEPLEVEDLYEILKNPNNPIILGKKEDFRSYGIDIRFEDDALRLLARMAYEEKTGARGLVSVIEKVLLPYEKSLPTSDVSFLVVTEEMVSSPRDGLVGLLANPNDPERAHGYRRLVSAEKREIRDHVLKTKNGYLEKHAAVFIPERIELALDFHLKTGDPVDSVFDEMVSLYGEVKAFEADFYAKHGFEVHFDDDAVSEIIDQTWQREVTAEATCRQISRDYDYGFKLISERSGQTRFVLPRAAVLHPDAYLDELIRESYRQYPIGFADMKNNQRG